jgi:hypothetical protein
MAEIYAEYVAAGSPPRGKCWNKPNKPNCKGVMNEQPDESPKPIKDPTTTQQKATAAAALIAARVLIFFGNAASELF